jgi:hypothetical protein
LVDEFQDVNRVQSEMLDLLTAPDRNYMAIGDDDQTIYEWRGADPSLILSFASRYGAARYFIRDNFRSHAAPLALANRVIACNRKREPKRLSLTYRSTPKPRRSGRGSTLLGWFERRWRRGIGRARLPSWSACTPKRRIWSRRFWRRACPTGSSAAARSTPAPKFPPCSTTCV